MSDVMPSECCENCRFSRRSWRDHLECRRHAAVRSPYEGEEDGFPQVLATEWCGEFRALDTLALAHASEVTGCIDCPLLNVCGDDGKMCKVGGETAMTAYAEDPQHDIPEVCPLRDGAYLVRADPAALKKGE